MTDDPTEAETVESNATWLLGLAEAYRPVSNDQSDGEKSDRLTRIAMSLTSMTARKDALNNEREIIAIEVRRYASHYPAGSDGRNTFVMLADWIEARIETQVASEGHTPVNSEAGRDPAQGHPSDVSKQ